ncbi:MAG: hypothetical protein K9M01_02915 [Candidatus Omnitrophica bacterium]|nr:hypothetical protein [Candidatus Omnitrophota bacterium]
MKRKLTLKCDFTEEEDEILKIISEILHKTKDVSIYHSWLKIIEPKELGAILYHLLFSCRDFLGCIFTIMHDFGYHSAYILGSSFVEYFIDFSFILSKKELVDSRAKEYFIAYENDKKPFSNDQEFKRIEKRAEDAGLGRLYEATYRSLCSFKHVNLKGYVVTRRDARLKEDRKKFLLQMANIYLWMWKKLKNYLGNNLLDEKIISLLNIELIEIGKLMRRYPSS